jgi:hypothetical protein
MNTGTLLSTLEGLINTINNSNQLGYVLWYNYVPSEWASISFLVLFGLSTCAYVPFVPYFVADSGTP